MLQYAKSMQIPAKVFNLGIFNIQNACKYLGKILTWERCLSHYLSVFCAHCNIFHNHNIRTPDNMKYQVKWLGKFQKNKPLWETSNNKGGHIYITHRLFAYEHKFAQAGSNWNFQEACFFHEDIRMLGWERFVKLFSVNRVFLQMRHM